MRELTLPSLVLVVSLVCAASAQGQTESSSGRRLTGTVRSPDGQPAAGVELRIVGGFMPDAPALKTDQDGKFDILFNPRQFGMADIIPCLLARDPARNLAVAHEIDEESAPLDLRLAPGLTLRGRAEFDGKPITNATAALVFWTGNSGMHLPGLATGTNQPGRFEIPAVPPGRRYGLYISAPGFGQKYVNVAVDAEDTLRLDVEPAELLPANQVLAGIVVDADDNPVSGANVHLSGDGQPNANIRSDAQGRFHFPAVCEGDVGLYANARNSNANTIAIAGDTNVVLKLGESSMSYSPPSRASLTGKPLPDLSPAGLQNTAPADTSLLLCLVDMDQRPSRRAIAQLGQQFQSLSQKRVFVAVIHVAPEVGDSFQARTNSSAPPFPVGTISEKSKLTRWATDVESLPWLILTDETRTVIAEGFPLDELESKLQRLEP